MKKMRSVWKFLFASFSLTILLLSFVNQANAEAPYDTFSENGFGRTIFTQPAYEPAGVMADDIYLEDESGEKVYSPLKQPQDLFVTEEDEIYIADTGNNRVVHLNKDGELIRVIDLPDNPFNQPSGVFIGKKGEIYIADTGNKRVVQLSNDGEFKQEFTRPESKYIDDNFVYEPTNVVVDRRGFLYVVSRGTYQGIIQFDPNGNFYGFYGTNMTEVSFMDRLRNTLYTEEQLKRQVRLLPNPVRNIDIDKNGFIYTVSRDKKEQIKKLNIRGENQWKDFSFDDNINLNFLQRRAAKSTGDESDASTTEITDVTVDSNGIVTVIDKANAIVAQFDLNGELLFFWGAPVTSGSAQVGVSKSPVALDTNSSNQILILDDSLDLIQVLKPTTFGSDIQKAFILTQEGRYDESEEYWNEIAKHNALFTTAYEGLARAAFTRGDYNKAMELYQLAGDEVGYSESFWQVRLAWFQKNFDWIANCFIALLLLGFIWLKIAKKMKKKKKKVRKWEQQGLVQQFKDAFYILRHPLDGFANIRYRDAGGYISACIILIGVIIIALSRVYVTSFTFLPVPVENLDAGSIIISGAVLWVSWVICHFLIGTIRQGQARFKDVFVGSAYSLLPILLLGLPLALVSNIMTLSEGSIYMFFDSLIIIWVIVLFFWMVQSIQNYLFGETVINVLLTIFSMIMLWVLIFIIVGLASETIDFIRTVYQEVTM